MDRQPRFVRFVVGRRAQDQRAQTRGSEIDRAQVERAQVDGAKGELGENHKAGRITHIDGAEVRGETQSRGREIRRQGPRSKGPGAQVCDAETDDGPQAVGRRSEGLSVLEL